MAVESLCAFAYSISFHCLFGVFENAAHFIPTVYEGDVEWNARKIGAGFDSLKEFADLKRDVLAERESGGFWG